MARKIKLDEKLIRQQQKKSSTSHSSTEIHCKILIVCEGTKTEPNYFKSFNKRYDNVIYDVQAMGTALNTIGVVNKAIEIRNETETKFDCVWAVFDKDNFPPRDFNNAILKAAKEHINVAWSNEAFELWYLYHFQNRITAMSRDQYKKAIEDAVNSSGKWTKKEPYHYKKNDSENYNIVTKIGNQEKAINWAKAQHETYTNKSFHTHNPCTTVYQLVLQLINKDQILINEVMDKINNEQ